MYIALPTVDPYPHQRRILRAIKNNLSVVAIIHRRAGKDVICLESWVLRGLTRVGTHVYLFPMYAQARAVIWEGMDYSGTPFLSRIPESIIASKNEARMEIKLINGSRLILAGSNNIDSLMGTNPVTIIYSEFALHHPMARQYLNPIIIQNDGIEIIQSTTRGKNHLFTVYQQVIDNPRYHVEYLTVEDTVKNDGTRIITPEQIEEGKRMGMSTEMIRQEFYCDFDVGNQGAYYTLEMSDFDRERRGVPLQPNPNFALHSVWDLGGTDATAGLLFQVIGDYIHVLHVLHSSGKGFKFYLDEAERLRAQMGLQWGMHFGPHDIKQKHQGWESTESRLSKARTHGWIFQVTPKVNVEDGIESVRSAFPRFRICGSRCSIAIQALREYQRRYDEVTRTYSNKPLDNWAVHIADAFRYLAVNYKRVYAVPQQQRQYAYQEKTH